MIEYERIDISEGIDLDKSDKSKECDICHYWYFLDKNFNAKSNALNDAAIVSINGSDCRIHFWYMNKSDANSLLDNSVLDNKGVL